VLAGLAIAVPIVAAAIAALNAPREESKKYHFPRVEIEATIEPDGDLRLVEERTFDFTGPFSFAYFTIEPTHAPPERIQAFTVTEGGRELNVVPSVENGGYKAQWFFDARDERRTFTIGYEVNCAVDVYGDAAHLLWQFVGKGWTERTDLARVTVHLPEVAKKPVDRPKTVCPEIHDEPKYAGRPLTRGEARVWGHGPFSGTVRFLDPQTVRFEVRDLPPATFIEGSILLPADAVPLGYQHQTPLRAAILEEEQRLADETNALRRRHRFETGLTSVLYWLAPLLVIWLLVVSRRRDRVPGVPRMLEEPPEDRHPAELAVLWSAYRKRLSPKNAYRAQLLQLARTGAVTLMPVGTVSDPSDLRLGYGSSTDVQIDQAFRSFLFDGAQRDGDGPLLRDIRPKGGRRVRLQEWWKAVGKKTRATIERMVKGRNRLEAWAIGLVGWGAAAYGLWRWNGFEFETLQPVGLVGVPAAWLIPIGIASWFLGTRFLRPRLSEDLRRRMQGWAAFRRFLKRFSSLPEAPALAVTIWEHYLVYAVALGVGDRVEKQVRALVPADELEGPWPGAPPGEIGSHYYHHVGGRAAAYSPASAAIAIGWSSGWGTGSSSGSGGGGGFSGGGGGGGGGTGGGAG
jgi:uncharacterized membrane protein YgcG